MPGKQTKYALRGAPNPDKVSVPVENEEECCICLEPIEESKMVTLRCCHKFHGQCLCNHLVHDGRCPICRDNPRNEDDKLFEQNFEQMFHQAAYVWASQTIENRLMDRKRQKQNLVNMCPDFDIPVVEGTKKRQIAQELARNLLQFTDDEDEE